MAYPATLDSLQVALGLADAHATRTKGIVQTLRNASAAGPVGRQSIINLVSTLSQAIAAWNTVAARPGIAAYAQEQKGNASLDVAAEFMAMVTQATSLRDWIVANFPRDAATQAALIYVYDSSGNPTELTFTTADLVTFRTKADAFTATIS